MNKDIIRIANDIRLLARLEYGADYEEACYELAVARKWEGMSQSDVDELLSELGF